MKRTKSWPKAANALSRRLNRLAPQLREVGIELSEDELGHAKTKIKILRMIDAQDEEDSQGGASSDEGPTGNGDDASQPSSEMSEEADDDNPFNFDFGD